MGGIKQMCIRHDIGLGVSFSGLITQASIWNFSMCITADVQKNFCDIGLGGRVGKRSL